MSLVERIVELKGNKTQEEFAAELGIDQGGLSRILRGERNIGLEIARKIRRRYPELTGEIAAFLLAEDRTNSEVSII